MQTKVSTRSEFEKKAGEVSEELKKVITELSMDVQMKSVDDSKFRIRGKSYLMTYRGHIDKGVLGKFYEEVATNRSGVEFFRAAHETGGSREVPYAHTHVLVKFMKPKESISCRVFDIRWNGEVIHPNVRIVGTNEHWENCLKYLGKEDPANEDLKEKVGGKKKKPDVVEMVHKAGNLTELLTGHRPTEVCGLLAANDAIGLHGRVDTTSYELRHDWQRKVERMVTEDEWNYREVMWVYDEVGGSGKTLLSKYLRWKYEKDWIAISDFGTVKDLGPIIEGEISRGWKQVGIIVDLPRGCESCDTRLYAGLEALLNGEITSTKYRGNHLIFKPPKVMVMSNWKPKVSRNTLSSDRWYAWKLVVVHRVVYDQGPRRGQPNIDLYVWNLVRDYIGSDTETRSVDDVYVDLISRQTPTEIRRLISRLRRWEVEEERRVVGLRRNLGPTEEGTRLMLAAGRSDMMSVAIPTTQSLLGLDEELY